MHSDSFQQSQETGIHHWLAGLEGRWVGVTRLWLEPNVLHDESPTRGRIRPVLEGRFMLHEYEGAVKGTPLQGMALIGCSLAYGGKQEIAWTDSWHMSTGILFSTGVRRADGVTVLGHYGDGQGGPDWGWRTEIRRPGPDEVVITMYNITPQGDEAKAVETTYRRVPDAR